MSLYIVNYITANKVVQMKAGTTHDQMVDFLLREGIKETWAYKLLDENQFQSLVNEKRNKYGDWKPPLSTADKVKKEIMYRGKPITNKQHICLRRRCRKLGILETKEFLAFDQGSFEYCLKFLKSKGLEYNPKQ